MSSLLKLSHRPERRRWQRVWSVLWPYWVSSEKWGAWILLLSLVVVLLIRTGLQVLFLIFGGELTSALAAQDSDRFVQALVIFLVVLVVGVPFASLAGYIGSKLGLYWRDWLTRRYLDRYLDNAQFYQLRLQGTLDNPDQRLETDIRTLTQESLKFFAIGLESILQLIGFAGVLWAISQPLMLFLVVYSVLGTAIATLFFGRMLVGINLEQLKREADYRFGLARIRENAEAIALYRGEQSEQRQSWRQFIQVFDNFKRLIRWQLGLNLFQNHYRYVTFIVPGLILAPRLFAGDLEIGDVTQAGSAFNLMLGALALIVLQMQQLTNLGAAMQRLGRLHEALSRSLLSDEGQVDGGASVLPTPPTNPPATDTESNTPPVPPVLPKIQRQVGDAIALKHLTLQTPDGQTTLVHDLSLTVADQQHLLIMGPSGVGKSALLRAIAGLWQVGTGTITTPDPKSMMFLPQRPYLIRGSLRQQLLYPSHRAQGTENRAQGTGNRKEHTQNAKRKTQNFLLSPDSCLLTPDSSLPISDDAMIAVLEQVNLADLLSRWGSLDGGQDAMQTLSGGEQQRLALARLLLHPPRYALLDEATSALDLQNEACLYKALQTTETTFISVGHRFSLRQYHQQFLEITIDQGWTIRAISQPL
ncbi:MAG: ATP-binding cassette domain-containing protein [Cyanobacteria bacterium J06639_14]